MARQLKTDSNGASEPQYPQTQRAYTLRLRGIDPKNNSWRDALWATHEAINKGAKAFGDWLLTLRGGLSHELAEPPPPAKGKNRTDEETAALRKYSRILLALSWLSVEDEHGAPTGAVRVTTGKAAPSERKDKVLDTFRSILTARRITKLDIESWMADCADSLSAKIRDDSVWINRSACFDQRAIELKGLSREYAAEAVLSFFGPVHEYFKLTSEEDFAGPAAGSDGPEFRTLARQWASTNFGTGEKTDTGTITTNLRILARADLARLADTSKEKLISELSKKLGGATTDIDGLRVAIGWKTGRFSKGRLAIENLPDRLTKTSIETMQQKFLEEADAKESSKGLRKVPKWMPSLQESIESACGMPFKIGDDRDHISEFSVMLDHAARRVSIGHSWIKRAEAERRHFETETQRLDQVPPTIKTWLDKFVQDRCETSGASAAGGEYRIRRRAIEGWDEVVKKWKRAACKTEDDRVAAVREAQSDPEIDKFGDIQLFEALAAADAEGVWRIDGKADSQPLKDYVLGHDARNKKRRFKVPAFRHPDPLRHPVFCDFGNSRWTIEYAVHQAAKVGKRKRFPATSVAEWLNDRHGVCMGLWDGNAISRIPLRWSSKRLSNDLALRSQGTGGPIRDVARADRLGRAASGLKPGESPATAGLFALDDWNGRLQAPRAQLNAIAACIDKNAGKWDDKAKKLRDRIEWLVSFSAKLNCHGPFIQFAIDNKLIDPSREIQTKSRNSEDEWRGVTFPFWHADNEGRKGQAKHILSRLPGLRVLSVDLGHRFAASCAVWETLPHAALRHEIADRAVVDGGTSKQHLYVYTRHTDARGKERTTIYRRIGNEKLPGGSDHPAPWARLDRQFLIKLQGEDALVRKSSPEELKAVRCMETELGRLRDEHNPLPPRVDELIADATRTMRLALHRLGDCARIAYAFNPDAARLTPGGGSAKHTSETRKVAMRNALMRWHNLATGDRWRDPVAKATWTQHIVPMLSSELPTLFDEADRWARKRHRTALEVLLDPVAAALLRDGAEKLNTLWAERWKSDNAAWRPLLKWLRHWVLPRRLRPIRGVSTEQSMERKARRGTARHVGGLSLTRIATIRELYQVQKAYAMRPEPDDLRKNIAAKDDDRFDEFGRSVLDVVERLRKQRVKQLASRIAEAALGIGRMTPAADRNRKRPTEQVDRHCHAVVIENLRNYRPDELQTRRENRALMNWSAGKVRKYLEEACQLHGLHLREVMPNYTSRQCSRTGLPGLRCDDVPIADFLTSPWWTKLVSAAEKRINQNGTDSLDRFFVALRQKWTRAGEKDKSNQRTLRIPRMGGNLFIASAPASLPNGSVSRVIQADLNAAANIGLRALLDPDFPAKWWYIPCDSNSGQPAKDKCAGAACVALNQALLIGKPEGNAMKESKRGEKTNAWRDPSATSISAEGWEIHAVYWNGVKARIVESLRAANGL
ncbi:MAG: type V CRISPR-associated protein Cas12b [Planctomycetota bacterium]